MSLSRITLESFDDDSEGPPPESEDYLRGFSEGVRQAEARQDNALNEGIINIAATLADMSFGFAEARLLILDRVRPLLAQIAETVLPDVLEQTFAAHVIEVLERDFDTAMDQPVSIAIAPELHDKIQDQLPHASGSFQLISDPNVASGHAIVQSGGTQIMIDMPSLLSDLQTALHGLEQSERTISNG